MSAHDEQQAKTLAETIADELFINGFGEKAVRLKMVDATERDLGGWCRAAVVQKIAACLRASPETGWREISTAPKDGTQILLWITGIEPRPRIGFWAERGVNLGWYGLQSQHFIGMNVTHWQPLPPSPRPLEAEQMETKNAIITSAEITNGDHGLDLTTIWLCGIMES